MTNLTLDEKKALIRMALEAREQAYAPYSDFMVGAALRAEDGRIFTGCNVENAAFTPTSCAERTALFKAVSEGVTRFTDIAVVGSRRGEVNKRCHRKSHLGANLFHAAFQVWVHPEVHIDCICHSNTPLS